MDKIDHVKSLFEQTMSSSWAAAHLVDRKELQGEVWNEKLS